MGRDSTLKALNKYLNRTMPKTTPKRANKAPERAVVRELLAWCKSKGWSVDVVESKAVYNAKIGRYLKGQTVDGMPDIIGNDNKGISVFIEVKAKGKRSTLRDNQREFLIGKIKSYAFAVCVDSPDLLNEYYDNWSLLRNKDLLLSSTYLFSSLPKKRETQEDLDLKEFEELE